MDIQIELTVETLTSLKIYNAKTHEALAYFHGLPSELCDLMDAAKMFLMDYKNSLPNELQPSLLSKTVSDGMVGVWH